MRFFLADSQKQPEPETPVTLRLVGSSEGTVELIASRDGVESPIFFITVDGEIWRYQGVDSTLGFRLNAVGKVVDGEEIITNGY